MATNFAPGSPAALHYLASLLAQKGVDTKAASAVFSQEGASGGIGDGGHAFGPGQFNDAGGVWTGRNQGMSPQQKNQVAWSPQGLAELAQRVAAVASGQHGAQAVRSIVSRFERPADPSGEIARALAHYGGSAGGGGGGGQAPVGGGPAPAAGMQGNPQLLRILAATREAVGLPALSSQLARALQARQTAPVATRAPTAGAAPQSRPTASPSGHLTTVDGIQVDQAYAPLVAQLAARFHVTPTSGYRDPAHNKAVGGAPNSDHLRGDAVDFGGNPATLQALYQYAQGRYPYIEPMSQAKDHVHISFHR